METFGKFMFGTISLILMSIFGGYVLMKLWDWFIVYAFALNSINLIQAIGLSFFISYIKARKKENEEKTTFESFLKDMGNSILFLLITLGLGYLITLFQ
jgi:hypothetical protein